MTLAGYSNFEAATATPYQREVGKKILDFLTDCGEECDVILEFDDPEEPFQYIFTGTTLALSFDNNVISVLDFDLETGEDRLLEVFSGDEINKATHWLLTQVNEANSNS